ncbi:MAG: YceH family protein [Phycisphaerales bacterium]
MEPVHEKTALLPDECRVLGTLIEKAMTVATQYPLSLNSLVTGVNQKNNRDPVVEVTEDDALRAVDGLRAKGLVRDVTMTGSRVEKYRHVAGEALGLRAPELAIVAELLLRGPQTVGELRGRASRMQALESLEVVENILQGLSAAGESRPALVRELPPLPGSRATRWMQLLCEDLHPVAAGGHVAAGVPAAATTSAQARIDALEARVAALESVVGELRKLLD